MNYAEIVALALAYTNRSDADVTGNIDMFLRMAESRINTELRTREMSNRATLEMDETEEYYCLPPDFAGLRDIMAYLPEDDGTKPLSETLTLKYFNPEQLNSIVSADRVYYTIIGNQLHIRPTIEPGCVIEILYHVRVPPLTSTANENWISTKYPSVYINSLVSEIELFVQNTEAYMLWSKRFDITLGEVTIADLSDTWSGPALQVRAG